MRSYPDPELPSLSMTFQKEHRMSTETHELAQEDRDRDYGRDRVELQVVRMPNTGCGCGCSCG